MGINQVKYYGKYQGNISGDNPGTLGLSESPTGGIRR
ncbi:hypothetical protein NIES46_11410 [Arthrospira platensis NIES-46]|uniref:Uncharacterized protein n=1 Tax=Limnospira platensis NIES-46 TaxID=1236695 RepID=A0A5M3T3B9_LIMPL|nr:hypothetical protein NIES46_11410 [Arthrospira platensis NIES-46]